MNARVRAHIMRTLLFVTVIAAGFGASALMAQGSLLYMAMPLVMGLAALGLPARAAAAAGLIGCACALANAVSTALALEALSAREWLHVALFAIGGGALLAGIAGSRVRSKLIAAVLIVAAAPAFVAAAVPLMRSLDAVQRSSWYIAMRDDVKIAVDVYLPRGAQAKSLPTILRQTRYFRRTVMRWPYSLLFGGGIPGDVRRYAGNGYAYVAVDARGSGASFGSRAQEWSDDEIKDGSQVVDWIVSQPWSSGNIGCTGVSYDGTACEMLLANHHPAVKAAAPRFSLLDGYTDIAFPGGIHLSWFTENWGKYNDSLDRNAIGEQLQGLSQHLIAGVAPVDGHEDLLAQAVASHRHNYSVYQYAVTVTHRDDASPSGLTLAHMSPYAKPDIAASGTPIYSYAGWYDGAYQRAEISRFLSYPIPGSRLIIGPWDHGGRQNPSPYNPPGTAVYDQTGALLRFFDWHLKGTGEGIAQEKPVRYYTMGAETWREADTWPPPAQAHTLHFAAEGALSAAPPPDAAPPDEYTVDLSATTGTGTRWHSYFNVAGVTIGYPDRAEQDRKLLRYESAPLEQDTEITGHPAITLWVASSAGDGQFFAYLEEVAPDGTVRYITEGQLRARHRKVNDAFTPYWQPAPIHSFLKADAQALVPGEPAEIAFALLPTSYRVPRGHRLRVALAGADVDQFAPLPGDAPIWRVWRDSAHASRVVLPIVTRNDAAAGARP